MSRPYKVNPRNKTATWVVALIVVALVVLSLRRTSDDALVGSTVDTTAFDGRYRLIVEESFSSMRSELAQAEKQAAEDEAAEKSPDSKLAARIADLRALLQSNAEVYQDFSIKKGVIRSGRPFTQEFSLLEAEITGDELVGVALWHEDVDDPGDAAKQPIRLKLTGNRLEFSLGDESGAFDDPVILEREPTNN